MKYLITLFLIGRLSLQVVAQVNKPKQTSDISKISEVLKTSEISDVSETLTLERAIAMTLENNQGLKIQQRQVDIAETNIFPGNAGLVPTISLQGNASYQSNDTDGVIRTFQENPATVNISDRAAATTTYSAVVQADYVLLGGFAGRYQYQLLKDERDLAYFQRQATINQTIVSVSSLFLEIAKLQSQEELLARNVKIGEERLKKVEDQFEFGKVTGLTVLRTKTDLNQDRTSLDNVLVAKNNLKRDLTFLIGLDADHNYRVTATYQPPPATNIADLKGDVEANNPLVQLSDKGVEVAQKQYQVSSTVRMPTINAFANYGYFNQENDLQQLAEIETLGYTLGVGIRYNIFSGGRTNRGIQNAKLNREISQFQKEETRDRVLADAVKEYNNLILFQGQLEREEENINTFRESYTRTEERFYNGKVSLLDLRDAQNALLNAEITLNNLKADIMKSSIRLEALKGKLLK
ncbi:MAG: TolC family protein [Bacteroidota bacterium]